MGAEVVAREADALRMLSATLSGEAAGAFARSVETLHDTVTGGGRILLTGLGKSGFVGRKVASTLCSTWAPAVFLHPSEAAHGDLGLITPGDALVVISRSGSVESLESLLSTARRRGVPVLGWTSVAESPLAREAEVAIVLEVGAEADPDTLIPSASSTAAMALGDAVAIALFRARGLAAKDFAMLHPGGILGRRLARQVRDFMHEGEALPRVNGQTSLVDALQEISDKRLGLAVIADAECGTLRGVLTDGDIRRALQENPDALRRPVSEVMTTDPRTIAPEEPVARAVRAMESPDRRITSLIVVDAENRPIGILHLHDCLGGEAR
jgi:arabinose-5-phosphate isomerase